MQILKPLIIGETAAGTLVVDSPTRDERWFSLALDPAGSLSLVPVHPSCRVQDTVAEASLSIRKGTVLELPNNELFLGAHANRGEASQRFRVGIGETYDQPQNVTQLPPRRVAGTSGTSGTSSADFLRPTPKKVRAATQTTVAPSEAEIPTLHIVVPATTPESAAPPPTATRATAHQALTGATRRNQTLARPQLAGEEPTRNSYWQTYIIGLLTLAMLFALWSYRETNAFVEPEVIIQSPKVDLTQVATLNLPISRSRPVVSRERASAPEPAAAPLATQQPVTRTDPGDALANARRLLDQGYVIWPAVGNAVSVLQSVLDLDPGNTRARAMLTEAAATLTEDARRAREDGFTAGARTLVEAVLEFHPSYLPAVDLRNTM